MIARPSVLFVCVHHAGQSQIATEEGIDISANQPKILSADAVLESDVVITEPQP